MTRDFKEALRHRRTYYHITNSSPISDEQIKEIIDFAVMNVPSAFNSQSTRIVLLLGKNHKKLWEITKETLKRLVSAEVFKGTEAKIDGSLAAGYGTILFFEDKAVVEQLQDSFPTYYDKFPVWAQQTSAMHQLAIWTMLEDAGLGASLQHYNPLIDETVCAEWKLDPKWELVAQMPNENYIFFGDSKNAPYGTKTLEEVQKLTCADAEYLLSRGVKALVVACNTATSAAIRILREKYADMPVIGIEPALKPAVHAGGHPRVLVMATPMTLREEKFHALMQRFEFCALQHALRTEVLAEEWVPHANVVHQKRRQQNDHHQQNGVFEIGQRLQLLCGELFRGNFMQQLLKPSEGAEKAADEASQQNP